MKLADLTPETVAQIRTWRFDRFIEKHEGPESWDAWFKYYDIEFLDINGYPVLLPLAQEHFPNITILRCIASNDGHSLTIFLRDTTYVDSDDWDIYGGYVALCDRFPGAAFFVAIFYHEWYIIDHTTRQPPPYRKQ